MSATGFSATAPAYCPRCGAAAAGSAQFCGGCGASLAGAPPPPPPAANQQTMFGATGGGQGEQALVSAPPATAFDGVMSELTALQAQIGSSSPPNGIQFRFNKFSWYALFKVKFAGSVTIMPGPSGQSQVSVNVRAMNNEMVIEWLCLLFVATMFIAFNFWAFGVLTFVFALIFLVGMYSIITSALPKHWAKVLVSGAAGRGSVAAPPPAQPSPPMPQPLAPSTFTSPRASGLATPAASAPNLVAQLTQLNELLQNRLITQADFDAKKAEILSRLTR